MATEQKSGEELSAMAKQAVEQAQGAAEQYFRWAQKTMAGSPWGDTELNKKLMSSAQQNIAATFAYVQKISQANNFQDLVRIQTEYVQAQMESFANQAKDFFQASTKAIAASMKKPGEPSS